MQHTTEAPRDLIVSTVASVYDKINSNGSSRRKSTKDERMRYLKSIVNLARLESRGDGILRCNAKADRAIGMIV